MATRYHRQYWQLAQRIHAQLTNAGGPSALLSLPEDSWNVCVRVLRMLNRAQYHRWPTAAQVCRQRLARELDDFKYVLTSLAIQLVDQAKQTILNPPEIYRELVNLQAEFVDVCLDVDEDRLSVTTAPIVLEDYNFGPFRIELNYQALNSPLPFRAIALEPCAAGSNSEVTHPHVSGGILCLGAGRPGVSAALTSGRLFDFFTIVDRLLHTYARGQAYVELDDWQGTPCIDCGSAVDIDDRYGCDRCEEVVCTDCFNRCENCDRILCNGCMSSCQHCEQSSCSRCLAECAQCGAKLCSDCFATPETCQKCHEESQSENSPLESEPTDGGNTAAETNIPAAAAADGLGQAELLS